jgi:hypothetical protein
MDVTGADLAGDAVACPDQRGHDQESIGATGNTKAGHGAGMAIVASRGKILLGLSLKVL